ncbi:MAG: hypothetical protein AB1921_00600 [Thermodesulfobacteriota bacterium]
MGDLISAIKRFVIKRKITETIRDWKPVWPRTITFDLDRKSVNGLGFGADVAACELFGKPDRMDARDNGEVMFLYQQNCLVLEFDRSVLDYAAVVLSLEQGLYGWEKIEPAPGRWADLTLARGGKTLSVDGRTREDAVAAFLGRPGNRDEDDEEIVLFYTINGLELEIELTKEGCVKRVNLFSGNAG